LDYLFYGDYLLWAFGLYTLYPNRTLNTFNSSYSNREQKHFDYWWSTGVPIGHNFSSNSGTPSGASQGHPISVADFFLHTSGNVSTQNWHTSNLLHFTGGWFGPLLFPTIPYI